MCIRDRTSTDAKGVVHRDVLETEFSVDQDLRLVAKVPSQAGGVLGLDADLKVRGNQLPLADFHFRSFLPRTSGYVSGQWHFASLRWLAPLVTEAPVSYTHLDVYKRQVMARQ